MSLILGRELQRTCMFPTFHPSLPLLGAFKTNCFCFLLPLEFLIEHGMCFYDLIFHCGCWVVSLKLNKLMWGLSFLFNFFLLLCLRLFASFRDCFCTTLIDLVLLVMHCVCHFLCLWPPDPSSWLTIYILRSLNSSSPGWSFVHVLSLNLTSLSS